MGGECRGEVVIAGGGPGDPGLVSVKALNALREADVVVYDRLAPRGVLEEARGAELIYVGKEPGRHEYSQEEINELLLRLACEGKRVVRLKGGDPFIYGRGEEECIYLASRGVRCRVIPGIPSFVAASALAGIPLTSRGVASSFAVITGREAEGKEGGFVRLEDVARSVDTLVILMGVSRLESIAERLARVLGWDKPAAAVIDASLPTQRVIASTLKGLVEARRRGEIRNPAVIIVGDVVSLRKLVYPGV